MRAAADYFEALVKAAGVDAKRALTGRPAR